VKPLVERVLTLSLFVALAFCGFAPTKAGERALTREETFKDCAADCPEMVAIPIGSFAMGSTANEAGHKPSEVPQHKATIANPLVVSKFAVTFAAWDACAAAVECASHVDDGGWGRGRQPVINVSWDDAQHYVTWLSRITGKTYRLLTEAEYEYAAPRTMGRAVRPVGP
jgi:formylglycine-generating enzyme required for sulfatase activity